MKLLQDRRQLRSELVWLPGQCTSSYSTTFVLCILWTHIRYYLLARTTTISSSMHSTSNIDTTGRCTVLRMHMHEYSRDNTSVVDTKSVIGTEINNILKELLYIHIAQNRLIQLN